MTEGILWIAPIVEGHGDELAVPILLRRLGAELVPPIPLDVIKPIRCPRTKLAKEAELRRATQLAVGKLRALGADLARSLVLVVADADDDLPCEVGPAWVAAASRGDIEVAVVLANPELETWFVAAAESLSSFLNIEGGAAPVDPEGAKLKKKWISDRFAGRYSETVDQPALAGVMDIRACRSKSPSFDKLCRELERRAVATTPTPQ